MIITKVLEKATDKLPRCFREGGIFGGKNAGCYFAPENSLGTVVLRPTRALVAVICSLYQVSKIFEEGK